MFAIEKSRKVTKKCYAGPRSFWANRERRLPETVWHLLKILAPSVLALVALLRLVVESPLLLLLGGGILPTVIEAGAL